MIHRMNIRLFMVFDKKTILYIWIYPGGDALFFTVKNP
jgi:hypothetical protein